MPDHEQIVRDTAEIKRDSSIMFSMMAALKSVLSMYAAKFKGARVVTALSGDFHLVDVRSSDPVMAVASFSEALAMIPTTGAVFVRTTPKVEFSADRWHLRLEFQDQAD